MPMFLTPLAVQSMHDSAHLIRYLDDQMSELCNNRPKAHGTAHVWRYEHNRHVELFHVQAKTAGGSSLVTSLCTLDNTVLACSFMLSLSLFTTRAHQGKAGLEPLAANVSLDILLDGSGEVYHNGPIQVQSAGLFNGQCLLAGAYPDGLLLLERDLAQEVAGCQARQREREKKQLEGEPI